MPPVTLPPSGQQGAAAVETPDLRSTTLYLNRELSWLQFNDRVLQIAENPGVPLLERVKFSAIYTTNLDEFYMVRVAGLVDMLPNRSTMLSASR